MDFIKTFLARLKSLTRLERARVELTLARIQNIAPIMFLFNLFLLAVSMLARIKAFVMGVLDSLGWSRPHLQQSKPLLIPQGLPPARRPIHPVVLLVVEDTIAQCFHYRVEQKLQQLQLSGLTARWVSWRELDKARYELHFAHIVIFYRVPAFHGVLETIRYARALNKVTIYDIDDLVFDRSQLEQKFRGATAQLPAHERNSMLRGAELYRQAIQECQFGIASTEMLRAQLARLIRDNRCFVLPNGVGQPVSRVSNAIPPPQTTHYCDVFYGSGTKTHDEDFAFLANTLNQLMKQHSNLRLILIGYLTLPAALQPFGDRICKLPPLEFESFLSILRLADINIAPLERGLFGDCKSEIKWLEAGSFEVPSVVSRTTTYENAIDDGVTGFLAADLSEWHNKLDALVKDSTLRESIGRNAKRAINQRYQPHVLATRFTNILETALSECEKQGFVTKPDKRIHLMLVNTLYPPQALGGATSVVVNIVRQLQKTSSKRYRLSIVTYDLMRPVPYQVRQYAYEDVDVIAISTPPGPQMDWAYDDQHIRDIFERILVFWQPDLVHFHSIQRLTASVLEACEQRDIPFVVTVHDAWWLSDHQFLLDDKGAMVSDLQRNPIVAAKTSAHLPDTLKRARYVTARLANAHRIFAVSNYQADLYRRNGFDHVHVNRNGVDRPVGHLPAKPTDKLRLGYAGGICIHKGYFFLKSVLSSLDLRNLALTVVDFDLKKGETNKERWGTIEVTFQPAFEYDQRAKFYNSIHVLVAPSMWPESFGLITREAALHGLWVVASAAGGLSEDISAGETGHIFAAGNGAQLKQVLIELNNNPDRYLTPPPNTAYTDAISTVAQQVQELEEHYQCVLRREHLGDRSSGTKAEPSLIREHNL